MVIQRTDEAEKLVEKFVGMPLIQEFVFHSPQRIKRRIQKEVVDLLISMDDMGIIVSQKCQQNVKNINDSENQALKSKQFNWALKQAKKAARQLTGVLRNAADKPLWCEHRRRGKVEFKELPLINHAVVVLEVCMPIDLSQHQHDLPLVFENIPITYLSLNDFLNLVDQFRSLPDIIDYLYKRHACLKDGRYIIGNEKEYFQYYLFKNESFDEYPDSNYTSNIIHNDEHLTKILNNRKESVRYSLYIEYIAEQLATRTKCYKEGLSPENINKFDSDSNRMSYIIMQSKLASLRFVERSILGNRFYEVMHKMEEKPNENFCYSANIFGDDKNLVYILCSSRGINRNELFNRGEILANAAAAYYKKTDVFVIIDCDGKSYECMLYINLSSVSRGSVNIGEKLFGKSIVKFPLLF